MLAESNTAPDPGIEFSRSTARVFGEEGRRRRPLLHPPVVHDLRLFGGWP
jgi:hypothetical protein